MKLILANDGLLADNLLALRNAVTERDPIAPTVIWFTLVDGGQFSARLARIEWSPAGRIVTWRSPTTDKNGSFPLTELEQVEVVWTCLTTC